MIFTSFAVAVLAATAGISTGRGPSGNQQEPIKPNFAYELTVANIARPKSFAYDLEHAADSISNRPGKGGRNPFDFENRENTVARTILNNFADGLEEAHFFPTQVRYLNYYSVEEIGPKRDRHLQETLDHSVVVFANEEGETYSFVDADMSEAAIIPDDQPHEIDGVTFMDSNIADVGVVGFKTVADKLAMIGMSEFAYDKVYGKEDLASGGHDVIDIGDMLAGNHTTGSDNNDGNGGSGGGSGGGGGTPEEKYIIGTIDWFRNLFLGKFSIDDEIGAIGGNVAMSVTDDPIFAKIPLGAYSLTGALEETDTAIALNAADVTNAMATAFSTNYDVLIGNNNIIIR